MTHNVPQYVTSQAYAQLTGRQASDVRRDARNGRIPGVRRSGQMGSRWELPVGTPEADAVVRAYALPRPFVEWSGAATYATVQEYAALTGETVEAIRADARNGRIRGAIRVAGPTSRWAIPLGVPDPEPTTAPTPELPPVHESDPLRLARRIAETAGRVHTRPAHALADLVHGLAGIALAHSLDRDGYCARCGWSYPCPDREAIEDALRNADWIIATGYGLDPSRRPPGQVVPRGRRVSDQSQASHDGAQSAIGTGSVPTP